MAQFPDVIDDTLEYTSDEAFQYFQDKDKTAEVYGYICAVEVPQNLGENKQYHLLKFGVHNDGSKKIMVLMWGKDLIEKYQADILINRKVHIDGAHCKASKYPTKLEQAGYQILELVIQEPTKVVFRGMHRVTPAQPAPLPPREVDFDNIIDAEGQVSINGFVRMEFTGVASRFQNATYGCGSITDGNYKITVNISNFQPLNLPKGTAVNVVGEVNNNTASPLTITCRNSSSVTERDGIDPLTPAQLMLGNKTYKRKPE